MSFPIQASPIQLDLSPENNLKFGSITYDSDISTLEYWNHYNSFVNSNNASKTVILIQNTSRFIDGESLVTTEFLDIDTSNNKVSGSNFIKGRVTNGKLQNNRSIFDWQKTDQALNGWLNTSSTRNLTNRSGEVSTPFFQKYNSIHIPIEPTTIGTNVKLYQTMPGDGVWTDMDKLSLGELFSRSPTSPVLKPRSSIPTPSHIRWQDIYLGIASLSPSQGVVNFPPILARSFLSQDLNASTQYLLTSRTTTSSIVPLTVNGNNYSVGMITITSLFNIFNSGIRTVSVPIQTDNEIKYQDFEVIFYINSTFITNIHYDNDTGLLLRSSGIFNIDLDVTIKTSNYAIYPGLTLNISLSQNMSLKHQFSNQILNTNLGFGKTKDQPIRNEYFDVGDILRYITSSNSSLRNEITVDHGNNNSYFLKTYSENETGILEFEFYSLISENDQTQSKQMKTNAPQAAIQNSKTIVRKSSSGVVSTVPDVCKTPSPEGPIPIPYPNYDFNTNTTESMNFKSNASQEIIVGEKQANYKFNTSEIIGLDYIGSSREDLGFEDTIIAPHVETLVSKKSMTWHVNDFTGKTDVRVITHKYEYQNAVNIVFNYVQTFIYDENTKALLVMKENFNLSYGETNPAPSSHQKINLNPIENSLRYEKSIESVLQTHPNQYQIDPTTTKSTATTSDGQPESSSTQQPVSGFLFIPLLTVLLIISRRIYRNIE